MNICPMVMTQVFGLSISKALSRCKILTPYLLKIKDAVEDARHQANLEAEPFFLF